VATLAALHSPLTACILLDYLTPVHLIG